MARGVWELPPYTEAASRRGESPPVIAAAQEIAALYLWIMEEATT